MVLEVTQHILSIALEKLALMLTMCSKNMKPFCHLILFFFILQKLSDYSSQRLKNNVYLNLNSWFSQACFLLNYTMLHQQSKCWYWLLRFTQASLLQNLISFLWLSQNPLKAENNAIPTPVCPATLLEPRSWFWERLSFLLCFHTVLVDNCLHLCVPLLHFIIVVSGGYLMISQAFQSFFLLICFFSPA